MIVVCTGCSAKFRVADEKVGPRGARLRCSKCQTVFQVKRPLEPPAPPPPPAQRPADQASAVAAAPPRVGPPPLPRHTTLDARAAFEVDLEPHHGQAPPPADPFAPPDSFDPFAPAAPAPTPAPVGASSFDPFQSPSVNTASYDPFGAPGSGRLDGSLPPLPEAALAPGEPAPGLDDPFGSAARDLSDPLDQPGSPASPRYAAGRAASSPLSLEELTTPPARRIAPAGPAPMPLLGATEDPFGHQAPLGPGLSELDHGVRGTASPATGGLSRGAVTPGPEPADEPPLQLDPFAAAAVAADPLVVDEPARPPPPPLAESTAERAFPRYAFNLRDVLVSATSLAALLLLSLAILVVWRGGLLPSDALRPSAIVAALAPRPPATPLSTSGVTSGLYERARGAPLLFVRGLVISNAPTPLEGVRVVVEVVRDGAVLARGEVPAGAVPGPEALYGAADAVALASALAGSAPAVVASLMPGGSMPFLVAFADYPANLAGVSLRVQLVAGPAR